MKPIIKKKDKTTKGEQRYVLVYPVSDGIANFTFTASKLLDLLKKSKIIKGDKA